MSKKEDKVLEFTLEFITEVKESVYVKENCQNIFVSSRMNEPCINIDEDEQPILSFCN